MEKELRLRVHANGKWTKINEVRDDLGMELENGATTLIVELPRGAYDAFHFLEIVKPSGVTFASAALPEVTEEDGVHVFKFSPGSDVLNESGRYVIQYVGRKGSQRAITFKSDLKPLDVKSSINAGVEIYESSPDFITWATAEIAALKKFVTDLPEIAARLKVLEELVGQNIYMGVIFYGEETVGIRLGAAQGKRAGVNGAPNDFDSMPIYKDIHTYFNDNGEKIWACETPFYYKHVKNGDPGDSDFFEAHYISLTKQDESWGLDIAFWDKEKKNRGRFTLGAFKAGLNEDGTKLVTKPGLQIKTEISLEEARPLAEANNAHVAEMRKFNAVNILMLIEFAVRDFQRELFKGVTFAYFFYGDETVLQEQGPSNVVRTRLENIIGATIFDGDVSKIREYYRIGSTVKIYDENYFVQIGADRVITSFEIKTVYNEDADEDMEVVELGYSGPAFDWTDMEDRYPMLINVDFTTGQCDGLPGSSHERLDQADGVRHFAYRGLEDIYGLLYEWADGEALKIYATNVTQNRKTHYAICFDPEFYHESNYNDDEDRSMSHFEEVMELYASGGYVSAFENLPEYPGVLVPYVDQGSDSTYYGDYSNIGTWGTSANPPKTLARIFYRGSFCSDGFSAGPFCVYGDYSTYRNGSIGLRLSYDPS